MIRGLLAGLKPCTVAPSLFFLPELDLSSSTLLRWTRWMRPLSTCQLVGRCCSAIPGTPRLWRKSISSCLFSDSLSPALCVVRARLFCFITACLHDHFCLITARLELLSELHRPWHTPIQSTNSWPTMTTGAWAFRHTAVHTSSVFIDAWRLNSNSLPAHSNKTGSLRQIAQLPRFHFYRISVEIFKLFIYI